MAEGKVSFAKGVHPHDNKALSSQVHSVVMPDVNDHFVAIAQHIGVPATPIVAAGDSVAEGQLIAQAAEGKLSANIFSPVSGKVVGIVKRKTAAGAPGDYIHIKREGKAVVTLQPLATIDKASILKRVEEAGVIGLGGAGFPTAPKLKPAKPVDTLIINAAECEPYLNCDNRLLIENTKEVVDGIKLIAQALGVSNIIVGIEDNKPEAIEALANSGLNIVRLPKKYPQGAEKVLIYTLTRREVPNKGGLPMDVGVVVSNVATAFAVQDAVRNNRPLYRRMLTVSGRGITTPKNIWVKNGTTHQDIFAFCGGLKNETIKLLSGGPMMGIPMQGTEGQTTKTESGLLALTAEEANTAESTPCINCGNCARVCPMRLMPMYFDFYIQAGDLDNAIKYGGVDCIECGCCSFECPAKRTLVQSARLTKQKSRERK